MRLRRLLLGVLLVLGGGAAAVAAPSAAGAQDGDAPQVSVPHIIPQPNSGEAPKSSTDRGGWAQYAVFWGMCTAVLVIVGLVWRESRRKLRARAEAAADAQAASSTRSEPTAASSEKRPEASARQ